MMPSSNQRSYSRFIPSEEVGDFKQWKFSAVDGSDLVEPEPEPEPVAELPAELDEAAQQAQAFVALGFKLGFGGAVTYDRALQLRRLAAELPLGSLVMETDSPDIPPHWLYTTAAERAQGQPQGRNTPAELPRIAQVVADLRGMAVADLAQASTANACAALPGLQKLLHQNGL